MKGANSRHVKRWPSGHASACPGEAIIRLLRMFTAEHLCVTSISSTRPFHPFLGYLCCAGGCEESRHKISWLLLCTSATLPRSSSANRASPDVISAPLMGAMALAIKLSAAAPQITERPRRFSSFMSLLRPCHSLLAERSLII
jgi:hypothetical protein